MIEEVRETLLFDLDADQHPVIVAKLAQQVEVSRIELGDVNVIGKGARFFDQESRRIAGKRPFKVVSLGRYPPTCAR